METHGLDTASQVFFYEQDFYVLSNFSAFQLFWRGEVFPTSEHAYQWAKFDHPIGSPNWATTRHFRNEIKTARSAHEAFKLAENNNSLKLLNWNELRVGYMTSILMAKAGQHEYVRRKLLATGDRELVENSWRDNFWGWGPSKDGKNMLGKLWMEVRAELKENTATDAIKYR